MNNNFDWDLILDYLQGNCSEEEIARLEKWKNEDEQNRKEFQIIEKIWSTEFGSIPKPNKKKAYENVLDRINNSTSTIEAESNFNNPDYQNSSLFTLNKYSFLKAAALLLIFLSGIYLIANLVIKKDMKELYVENGTTEEVIFSDSSTVKLDAGSTLKFPEVFRSDIREVYLEGEGLFTVKSDIGKPFIIKTEKAEVEVIGTEFNVRSFKEENNTSVAVLHGMVSLRGIDSNDPESKVFIEGGQLSEIGENGIPLPPEMSDIQKHISWGKREMYFKNAPFRNVTGQLERWYDLNFILPDNSYSSKLVTVYIENKPVEEILELLSLIMDFNYQINEYEIVFTLRENK